MAETKRNQSDTDQSLARRERDRPEMQRWSPAFGGADDPFDFMTRVSEEMDRTFERLWSDFGVQRRRSLPRWLSGHRSQPEMWRPRIEAFQNGDRFVVRAEIPGVKKGDIELELTDEALTIRGERREEREEQRDGYIQSERQYGQFYRVVPLPEGVIGESAEATFRDGVLEVSMQAAPAETKRSRKLEITEGAEAEQKK